MKEVVSYILIILLLIGLVSFYSSCSVFGGKQDKPVVVPPEKEDPPDIKTGFLDAVREINWLLPVAILGIGMSIFSLVLIPNSKLGFAGLAACSVTLFIALAVARFAWWMAVFGLMAILAANIAVVVGIVTKNKAVRQLVKGFQLVKESEMPLLEHQKIANTIMHDEQSPSTEKMVLKVKSDLKLKKEIE